MRPKISNNDVCLPKGGKFVWHVAHEEEWSVDRLENTVQNLLNLNKKIFRNFVLQIGSLKVENSNLYEKLWEVFLMILKDFISWTIILKTREFRGRSKSMWSRILELFTLVFWIFQIRNLSDIIFEWFLISLNIDTV